MRLAWLALVVAVVPLAAARAQDASGGGGNAQAQASASATPTASASEAPTGRPATGYGWSSPKPQKGLVVRSGARHVHRPAAHAPSGPIATLPGFEMLPEGGSRLFVELTKPVQVDERKARGKLTYVLHGAHVAVRNNENPLVTVHFNTPVTRARLVPVGNDLHFVIDLRADATPTWKGSPGKEGSFVLTIDFPKGSYIPHASP